MTMLTTAVSAGERIFHIAKKSEWQKAQEVGSYSHKSLEAEGFIHCSIPTQLRRVADDFFKGQIDLLLLEIDEDRLTSKIEWDYVEHLEQDFPHIYGVINLDGVKKIFELTSDKEGKVIFPAGIIE